MIDQNIALILKYVADLMEFLNQTIAGLVLFFYLCTINLIIKMENTVELFTDLIQYLHNKRYYEQINMNNTIISNIKYENKLEELSKSLDSILLIETKILHIQDKLNELNSQHKEEK